jgi:hypothetical protein
MEVDKSGNENLNDDNDNVRMTMLEVESEK